jgi:hypothetical protein
MQNRQLKCLFVAPRHPLRGFDVESAVGQLGLLIGFRADRLGPAFLAGATALSYDLEARTLANDGLPYTEVSRRRLLSATDKRHPLLGLFHPSPFLACATDPLAAGTDDLPTIRRHVRRQLKEAIGELGISVRKC